MDSGIKIINLIFEDGDHLQLDENLFSHFYIANIDDNANEIPYEKIFNTNTLYANFLSLKINKSINDINNDNIIYKIYNKKNLSEIEIITINDKIISFNIASSIDPFEDSTINVYDKTFLQDEDLCLLISPYKIKYKSHLFI